MVGAIEAGSRDTVENFKRFSLEASKVSLTVNVFCQHERTFYSRNQTIFNCLQADRSHLSSVRKCTLK